MNIFRSFGGIAAFAIATLAFGQQPGTPSVAPRSTAAEKEAAAARGLSVANKPWTGDFDKMLERRMIRAYAPYSRSLYFNDKGRERGLSAELIRDFERWLNQKYAKQLASDRSRSTSSRPPATSCCRTWSRGSPTSRSAISRSRPSD